MSRIGGVWMRGIAATALTLLAACGSGGNGTQSGSGPSTGPRNPAPYVEGSTTYEPSFDPSTFVEAIDNPYFPLAPGTRLTYRGESDGEPEIVRIRVSTQTKDILGIGATVVRDQVFVRGELTEDTFDWYGQDAAGNVWYLGEKTAEYENGKVVTREGSWEAGVDGAQPGILMLVEPRVGDTYRQEYDAGNAEDVARILRLGDSMDVPAGSYSNLVVSEDWTPLEPKVLERKYYAPGVGVVYEETVKGGDEVLRLTQVEID